jgi:hypothetical protein
MLHAHTMSSVARHLSRRGQLDPLTTLREVPRTAECGPSHTEYSPKTDLAQIVMGG